EGHRCRRARRRRIERARRLVHLEQQGRAGAARAELEQHASRIRRRRRSVRDVGRPALVLSGRHQLVPPRRVMMGAGMRRVVGVVAASGLLASCAWLPRPSTSGPVDGGRTTAPQSWSLTAELLPNTGIYTDYPEAVVGADASTLAVGIAPTGGSPVQGF